jgi:hypothetical protein
VSCHQAAAGETTDVTFDILDPVTVMQERLTGRGDPVSRSAITIHTVDKAGQKHTVEGATQTILLDGRKVATITIDNKQHAKAKVEKSMAGLAAMVSVISSPSFVFDRIAHAPELCPDNTVNPPHPDIFRKNHGCAICRAAKGGLLVGTALIAVGLFPEIAVGVGLAEGFGDGLGAGVAAAADAAIAEEFSCEARCKISDCVDKVNECLQTATPGQGEKSCDREFSACCRGAGGQCRESDSGAFECVSCRSPSFF